MIKPEQFFIIRKGEGKPTFILFAYFFFFGATLTVGKTARDTYFLNRFDITYLPLMFLVAAGVVAILAAINYFASKRFDLTKNLFLSILISGFLFAVSLIFIQANLNGLMIPILYVWIDVITIVINFQFVIYASMVFNSRQAKRLFGIILCGSPMARIVIGASIHPFVGRFGPSRLLTLAALLILCCVIMAWFAKPYIRQKQLIRQSQSGPSKSTGFLDGYLKMLALATGAAAVATVIVEYQFLILSNHAFHTEETLAAFFGTFYSVTGFISLFTQLFLTRWILHRFGILTAMRILPAGLGIGAFAVIFNPSLFSALIGRVSDQITKFTLNKTSFELLWVPVSPDQKQRKKLFIDDTIKTGMQGLTGVLIYALIKVWPIPYPALMQILSVVALVGIGVWLFTTSRLKNGYVSALVSAIEKRRLDLQKMRLDTSDSDIVKTIGDALNSNDEAKQVFALELISDFYLAPWSDTLKKLFKKGNPIIQAKIMAMAADHPDILSDEDLRKTIREKGLLAREALIISGKRNMLEIIPDLRGLLENAQHENVEICAAASTAVLMMKKGPCDLAQTTLEKLLHHGDENVKAIALRMLQHLPDFLTDTRLRECCLSDSANVCSAALEIARHRFDVSLVPCIIHCLKHPRTRQAARTALEMYSHDDVADSLNRMLIQEEIDTEHKIEIMRTLKEYPNSRSISILVKMLKHPSLRIQAESVDVLLKIARLNPLSPGTLQQLGDEIRIMVKHIYALHHMMGLVARGTKGLLIYDLFASGIEYRLPMLIKLLVLPVPGIPVETYIRNEKYESRSHTDNLIEIIENILPRRESGLIIPLFQDISAAERCRAGGNFFSDLPNELDTELLRLIQSPNEYHRIIGLDYAISQCRVKVLAQVDWAIFIGRGGHHEVIETYVVSNHDGLLNLPEFPQQHFQKSTKEPQMLSILEKTIILRGTNLFAGIPGENIYHVAQVMDEERLEKGNILFEKGDKGEYFYIIVTGEILIHIGEIELTRHGKGEYFGEMALLDDSPRSSSATATDETLLLRINQDNFLDVMMEHKEVRRSIMRVLNERSRRLTDRCAGITP